jgi:hypothetical protein
MLIVTSSYGQDKEVDITNVDNSISLKEFVEGPFKDSLQYTLSIKETATIKSKKLPLIIINKDVVTDFRIIEHVLFADIKQMSYNSNKELSKLYGTATRYGLIQVKMTKRKWRKLKRKYSSR